MEIDCYNACAQTSKCFFFNFTNGVCDIYNSKDLVDTSINQDAKAFVFCPYEEPRCTPFETYFTPLFGASTTHAACYQLSLNDPQSIGYNYVSGVCKLKIGSQAIDTTRSRNMHGYVRCSWAIQDTTESATTTTTTKKHCKKG
ncbi:uncharacterized protein LOC131945273 [Physella acuta]|uniref:uncharacterized protein LOC131945273 n=1 Tax=Physella acuta TaxID=109671 RepID=UPI0027DDE61B|nr:uncharacterized protein LOC131945273 [Physella acuta]